MCSSDPVCLHPKCKYCLANPLTDLSNLFSPFSHIPLIAYLLLTFAFLVQHVTTHTTRSNARSISASAALTHWQQTAVQTFCYKRFVLRRKMTIIGNGHVGIWARHPHVVRVVSWRDGPGGICALPTVDCLLLVWSSLVGWGHLQVAVSIPVVYD